MPRCRSFKGEFVFGILLRGEVVETFLVTQHGDAGSGGKVRVAFLTGDAIYNETNI